MITMQNISKANVFWLMFYELRKIASDRWNYYQHRTYNQPFSLKKKEVKKKAKFCCGKERYITRHCNMIYLSYFNFIWTSLWYPKKACNFIILTCFRAEEFGRHLCIYPNVFLTYVRHYGFLWQFSVQWNFHSSFMTRFSICKLCLKITDWRMHTDYN